MKEPTAPKPGPIHHGERLNHQRFTLGDVELDSFSWDDATESFSSTLHANVAVEYGREVDVRAKRVVMGGGREFFTVEAQVYEGKNSTESRLFLSVAQAEQLVMDLVAALAKSAAAEGGESS